MNKYFPGVPAKIYIVGMNKMMEMSVKILVNLLKPSLKQRMAFVDRVEQMDDLVSIEEVPVHAGGRNPNFQRIPAGARSGKCSQYLTAITPKEWDIYREINVGAIQEGMRESKSNSMELYLKTCDN